VLERLHFFCGDFASKSAQDRNRVVAFNADGYALEEEGAERK